MPAAPAKPRGWRVPAYLTDRARVDLPVYMVTVQAGRILADGQTYWGTLALRAGGHSEAGAMGNAVRWVRALGYIVFVVDVQPLAGPKVPGLPLADLIL